MQNPKRFLDYRDQPVLDVFEDGGLIGMMHGGKAKKKKKCTAIKMVVKY